MISPAFDHAFAAWRTAFASVYRTAPLSDHDMERLSEVELLAGIELANAPAVGPVAALCLLRAAERRIAADCGNPPELTRTVESVSNAIDRALVLDAIRALEAVAECQAAVAVVTPQVPAP